MQALGGDIVKRYRLYERALWSAPRRACRDGATARPSRPQLACRPRGTASRATARGAGGLL